MSNLREKKKKERKQRIFSAAVFLLNKKGFSNTSMQNIASRARLAVGTLYNYYTSKNDLIIDIFEQENQNYFVKLENLLTDLENSDQTAEEMIITILVDFMEDFLFLKFRRICRKLDRFSYFRKLATFGETLRHFVPQE